MATHSPDNEEWKHKALKEIAPKLFRATCGDKNTSETWLAIYIGPAAIGPGSKQSETV